MGRPPVVAGAARRWWWGEWQHATMLLRQAAQLKGWVGLLCRRGVAMEGAGGPVLEL